MRCLSTIGHLQICKATSNQERLAALRKAVEGLQAVPALGPVLGAASNAATAAPLQGLRRLDWGLPAEFPCGALNEVVAAHPDRPAAFGFLFALSAVGLMMRTGPALFIATRRALSDFGGPYGHGLAQLGLDVGRLILVEARTDKDALWALEETLRSEAQPAMVAGALTGGLDLTSSRRLNLAAAARRTPLALLSGANAAGTSAAVARWRISAAPAARDRFGVLAAPRWHVVLERSRTERPATWLIEWNHVAHRFRVVAGLADRPPVMGLLRHAG